MRQGLQNTMPPRKCRQAVQSQGSGLGTDHRPLVSDIRGDPCREATLLLQRKRAALQQRKPAESFKIDFV